MAPSGTYLGDQCVATDRYLVRRRRIDTAVGDVVASVVTDAETHDGLTDAEAARMVDRVLDGVRTQAAVFVQVELALGAASAGRAGG
ncbi:hypothetical protein [Nocardiopsis trehalosi]|jgi:hypothetical protein|uniref:hypothetical protein n=1 Tax=Nocardiopsis trehalosi TaxID=109329 RepID=UPI000832ED6B|nr:hypothetical protein [Nocardiopsis trehalosi]